MDIPFREHGTYRFGRFQLDPTRRVLTCDGERVKLSERLFDTLLYLVVHQGRLVGRDELLRAVWGNRIVESNNLAQAILGLRKALQAGESPDSFIVNTPGRGYRFASPVVFEPEPLQVGFANAYEADDPSRAAVSSPDKPATASPATASWVMKLTAGIAGLALLLAAIGLVNRTRVAPPAEHAFAPPAHSVAVLAFDNMSGEPGEAYFSDGLSEQLIDSLTRIDAIEVAGRISSFSFRGSHATVGEIGRALNVSAVLQGSVRRSGGRVIVTAQLTNALTGFNMWSNHYDRDPGDIVTVQTDIAQAVAQSLQVKLLGGEVAKLTLGGTTNAAAYDLYLRATRRERGARNEADHRAALADFDRVLALDPGFARAYVGRSTALSNIAMQDAVGSSQAQHKLFEEALAAADRALALAPGLSQAHSARAWALNFGLFDHAAAERDMAQAQVLTPGSSSIEGNYANIEITMGHVDVALVAARRGAQLDPLSFPAWGQLGRTLFMARRYDEAVEALHHAAALTDNLPPGYVGVLGAVLLMQGHPGAARTLCAAAASLEETEVLAIADHQIGRDAAAEADLAALRADQGDAGAFSYAEIYAQWGRKADALTWLETAVRLHDPGALEAGIDPILDPIRGEARFKQVQVQLEASVRQ